MKKLKLKFILLTLLLQLVFSVKAGNPPSKPGPSGTSDTPTFGNLISVEFRDIHGKVLFIAWAVYVGEKPIDGMKKDKKDDVFDLTDCTFVRMEEIKDRSKVYDFEVNEGDVIKCIKELKEKCKPLSEAVNCKPLLPFFSDTEDKLEAMEASEKLEFGDLVAFHRFTKKGTLLYIHWAVYVGKGKTAGLEQKTDEQDIFHIFGPSVEVWWKLSDCVFDTMERVKGKWKKFNYLDGREGWKPLEKDEIIKVITGLHHNCKWWDPFMNNCEHIATLVRYGKKSFEQPGAKASCVTKFKWKPTFTHQAERINPKPKRVWQDPSSLRHKRLHDQAVAGA